MAIRDIAFVNILSLPLVAWVGILTFLSVLTTATMGILLIRGKIAVKYHKALAFTTIALATIHAILGLAFFLNF